MSTPGLIGREAPLALLSAAITTAGDHSDAFLLVGERGIGRTACLLAAQDLAQAAGHQVVSTAGSQGETALPFAGLHRLLQPLFALTDALPQVQSCALLTALGMQDGPQPTLFNVSLGALSLVSKASEHRPLLMTIDDLQWLDEISTSVLTFVVRRLGHRRIVTLTTASWAEAPPTIAEVFREVRLERLDETASVALLRSRAPDLDPARRDWVVGQAVGNPLALVELAATPAPQRADPFSSIIPMSPALAGAFADHLPELPRLSSDAVLVAALASDGNMQEILAATALLSGQDVTTAVLEVPQALGLLRYDETRVHFAHPLVRSAVAQSESVNRRQAAHRALGETIVVNSHRRTWHRANGTAGRDDRIAAELEHSGSVSIRCGDTALATMTLERAAQLSTRPAERGRRLLLAARQAAGLGWFDTVDRLLAAAESDQLSGFDQVRADLLRDGRDDVVVGDSARVLRLCATARRAVAAGEDDLALELAYSAGMQHFSAPLEARAAAAVTALAGSVARDRTAPRALAVLAVADPVQYGRKIISLLPDLDREASGEALGALATAACAVGDYQRGSEFLDRTESVLRGLGLQGTLAPVLLAGVDVRLEIGDWDRATAALAELGTLTGRDRRVRRAEVTATAAKAAALRGETAAALRLVTETQHNPAVRRGTATLARAQIALGIAHLSAGRYLDAFTTLICVFDPKDPSHHFHEQFSAVMYLAEAASRSGSQDGAGPVIERMELMARESGSPLLLIHLRYARAVLAADETAEQLFLDCLASELASWPWPRARVQLAYGRWLRRQRQVRRSRGPLQSARSAFEALGAARWAQEALDELAATGHRSENPPASVPLSAQELKIARLAAEGLSNAEIGEQLGLSPRTVGSHLYRIFPKLKISARGQLAAHLPQEIGRGAL
ncbi:MAG: AAA family ATPase [Streptosporangiaceae bacterium]